MAAEAVIGRSWLGPWRTAMQFTEAEGLRNCLLRQFLYTNIKITENLEYWARLGYKEYKRDLHRKFERVFFEMRLGP